MFRADSAALQRRLRVRDLLHAVGKKCGVEPGMIDALDLENVVERTIAMQEGREPPEDTNDELVRKHSSITQPPLPPRKEPSDKSSSENSPLLIDRSSSRSIYDGIDLMIKKPVSHTLSKEMAIHSPLDIEQKIFPPVEVCQIEVQAHACDEEKEEPHVIIIEPPTTLEDIQLVEPIHAVPLFLSDTDIPPSTNSRAHSISASPEEKVPKKFKEKKEMYGRDPQKLFETYREEWNRLEKLSDRRHGHRRKSFFNLHGYEERRSSSTSTSENAIFKP